MSELRWLSLKELRIMNCSKMGSFVSTSSLENDSNSIKVFFVEKVVFPSLEKLRIDNLECVNTLWHTDTMAEAFSQLSILEVRNCNNLVKLIPSSLLPRLQNLEELHVNQCRLLEMILEQLEENSIEKVMFPKVYTVPAVVVVAIGEGGVTVVVVVGDGVVAVGGGGGGGGEMNSEEKDVLGFF
ncbi:uncharacterized protein LOC110913854 [Helianthus annuus]|uniref:uncharacterized protein LOC110913854 n=1 Tax=Helianthus annuus TaxID=4232 RepID=UPI000B900E1B|nr:uncharacterized protein LOC110913854 [Helianthus annuus]